MSWNDKEYNRILELQQLNNANWEENAKLEKISEWKIKKALYYSPSSDYDKYFYPLNYGTDWTKVKHKKRWYSSFFSVILSFFQIILGTVLIATGVGALAGGLTIASGLNSISGGELTKSIFGKNSYIFDLALGIAASVSTLGTNSASLFTSTGSLGTALNISTNVLNVINIYMSVEQLLLTINTLKDIKKQRKNYIAQVKEDEKILNQIKLYKDSAKKRAFNLHFSKQLDYSIYDFCAGGKVVKELCAGGSAYNVISNPYQLYEVALSNIKEDTSKDELLINNLLYSSLNMYERHNFTEEKAQCYELVKVAKLNDYFTKLYNGVLVEQAQLFFCDVMPFYDNYKDYGAWRGYSVANSFLTKNIDIDGLYALFSGGCYGQSDMRFLLGRLLRIFKRNDFNEIEKDLKNFFGERAFKKYILSTNVYDVFAMFSLLKRLNLAKNINIVYKKAQACSVYIKSPNEAQCEPVLRYKDIFTIDLKNLFFKIFKTNIKAVSELNYKDVSMIVPACFGWRGNYNEDGHYEGHDVWDNNARFLPHTYRVFLSYLKLEEAIKYKKEKKEESEKKIIYCCFANKKYDEKYKSSGYINITNAKMKIFINTDILSTQGLFNVSKLGFYNASAFFDSELKECYFINTIEEELRKYLKDDKYFQKAKVKEEFYYSANADIVTFLPTKDELGHCYYYEQIYKGSTEDRDIIEEKRELKQLHFYYCKKGVKMYALLSKEVIDIRLYKRLIHSIEDVYKYCKKQIEAFKTKISNEFKNENLYFKVIKIKKSTFTTEYEIRAFKLSIKNYDSYVDGLKLLNENYEDENVKVEIIKDCTKAKMALFYDEQLLNNNSNKNKEKMQLNYNSRFYLLKEKNTIKAQELQIAKITIK